MSRNIEISEEEVNNFLSTEAGEEMTQPEFRVVQASRGVKKDSKSEVASKEAFVDGVLASILAGTRFEDAVSVIEPYAFKGGDLGWRKIDAIPSMFAEVIPSLKVGDTAKIASGAGFHPGYLADERPGTTGAANRGTPHPDKPTEVLDEAAAEALAGSLRERALNGEDFADLYRSTRTILALPRREASWLTSPGQMVPEFEAAMASTAVGEISPPVESQFGWHILEVTGRREQNIAEDIRRQQVMGYLHDQKYEEELEAWLRKIREEAFVDIK